MDHPGRKNSAESRFMLGLIGALLLGGLLPVVGSVVCHLSVAEWRWMDVPLHSVVEALGAFAALALGVLILLLRREERLPGCYLWISCELLSMGLPDGFHAAAPPGGNR